MKQTVGISCDSYTYQTVNNYSNSDITSIIADYELSLHEAYDNLCEEVMKVKKLSKKLINKLTNMENEKSNLVKALKLLYIYISGKSKHLKTS